MSTQFDLQNAASIASQEFSLPLPDLLAALTTRNHYIFNIDLGYPRSNTKAELYLYDASPEDTIDGIHFSDGGTCLMLYIFGGYPSDDPSSTTYYAGQTRLVA